MMEPDTPVYEMFISAYRLDSWCFHAGRPSSPEQEKRERLFVGMAPGCCLLLVKTYSNHNTETPPKEGQKTLEERPVSENGSYTLKELAARQRDLHERFIKASDTAVPRLWSTEPVQKPTIPHKEPPPQTSPSEVMMRNPGFWKCHLVS
ncbi:unnamed protein product [Boreogadus saida]